MMPSESGRKNSTLGVPNIWWTGRRNLIIMCTRRNLMAIVNHSWRNLKVIPHEHIPSIKLIPKALPYWNTKITFNNFWK